jgi:hypothetical protein
MGVTFSFCQNANVGLKCLKRKRRCPTDDDATIDGALNRKTGPQIPYPFTIKVLRGRDAIDHFGISDIVEANYEDTDIVVVSDDARFRGFGSNETWKIWDKDVTWKGLIGRRADEVEVWHESIGKLFNRLYINTIDKRKSYCIIFTWTDAQKVIITFPLFTQPNSPAYGCLLITRPYQPNLRQIDNMLEGESSSDESDTVVVGSNTTKNDFDDNVNRVVEHVMTDDR